MPWRMLLCEAISPTCVRLPCLRDRRVRSPRAEGARLISACSAIRDAAMAHAGGKACSGRPSVGLRAPVPKPHVLGETRSMSRCMTPGGKRHTRLMRAWLYLACTQSEPRRAVLAIPGLLRHGQPRPTGVRRSLAGNPQHPVWSASERPADAARAKLCPQACGCVCDHRCQISILSCRGH